MRYFNKNYLPYAITLLYLDFVLDMSRGGILTIERFTSDNVNKKGRIKRTRRERGL